MSEHLHQCAVVQWCRLMSGQYPYLDSIFSIPNGGKRTKGAATWLIQEGLKKGVPDLFLPVPVKPFHGLFIEMKYKSGRPDADQKKWIKRLQDYGYLVRVCRSSDLAIETIKTYVGIK